MKPLRVVLADDHTLVRSGIRSLLERVPAVEVVAEADSGERALELVGSHRPDLVFADIAMKGMTGIELTARAAAEFPAVKIVILSMHSGEGYVAQALRAGAVGYLLKDSAAVELDRAIEAVIRNETYLSPAISRTVIAGYLARFTGGAHDASLALTPRQREVLALVASGKSTKEIAGTLNISAKTVESHRIQLMERLDIHTVPGLVRYAAHAGLIPPID